MAPLRILISNDDGVFADGIKPWPPQRPAAAIR